MASLTMRSYVGEPDLAPLVELLNLCDAVDQIDDSYSVDDLRTEFSDPNLDPQRDLRLWEDSDGRLAAFGQLWAIKPPEGHDEQTGFAYFRIHPDARGGGLEDEIIGWAEARLREVARERGLRPHILTSAADFETERAALLERHGYATERYFFTMVRPLDQPLPAPELPEGFTLRHVMSDADVALWVDAFNLSFVDHWNFHPETTERRLHWHKNDPEYAAERDLVITAPDGMVAAFCFCYVGAADNARNNRSEGWIATLGTRRGFRKLGLGRAALLAGMHKLKDDGIAVAKLGVDAENPSGALRLYESVGFVRRMTRVNYGKHLEA